MMHNWSGWVEQTAPHLDLFIMNNSHPIDHALAVLFIAFEGACWIINELAGFHPPLTAETVDDPRDIFAIEAPASFDCSGDLNCSLDGGSHDLDWLEAFARLDIRQPVDLAALKVTELRKRAKGLAKGVHLMRRAELLRVLA
jgi:hypothetical protein